MTVSVDVRTRVDSDAVPVDAAELFGHTLPDLIGRHGELAVPGARELAPTALTIDVDGRCWSLALDRRGIALTEGPIDDAALVQLTADQLSDLVNDVQTPMGFFTGGTLSMPRGGLGDFLDWWVVLRGLIDGRRVHTTGAITFRDRAGDPLDLQRSFTLDDPDEEMAHFLGEAGFLHIQGVFTDEEMAQVDADIDAAVPTYAPDDGRSWWAHTEDGTHRAVRLQYFHEHSPTTQSLLADDRYLRIGRLTSDGHRAGERHLGWNIIEALIKPIGVVEGISDVPWHKDCSLGRHSYRCCSMTVGISVTGADARSGQLRVVAGSHRALIQPAFVRRGLDLPLIDLPTRTGDITVHLSCTMHMSQPPVDRERRVMYTGFDLPARGPRDPAQAEKLSRIREGAYKTVSQPAAHRP